MKAYVPVRVRRGSVGPRGTLVPVRLDPCVRDQCALLLAHNLWFRFVAATETKWLPLVPVLATNRNEQFSIYTPRPQAEHSSAEGCRHLRCSSSPAIHMRCSMKFPS